MKRKDITPLKYVGLILRLGLSMALPVVFGVLAGRYLDRRLDTGGVLLVVSITIGILTSFRNLYHQASKITGKK
jgi:F0F1-type ATP synthase assembly protein I